MAAIILKIDSILCPHCGITSDLDSDDFEDKEPGNTGILASGIILLDDWKCPECDSCYFVQMDFL